MSDSQNPLYQKGYARGRKKTEDEIRGMREDHRKAISARRQQWLDAAASFMVATDAASGWSSDGKPATTSADRAKIAAFYADTIMKEADHRFGRMT